MGAGRASWSTFLPRLKRTTLRMMHTASMNMGEHVRHRHARQHLCVAIRSHHIQVEVRPRAVVALRRSELGRVHAPPSSTA